MLFQEPALASSASDFGRCSYAKPNSKYQNNHKLLVKNIFYSNKSSNYSTNTSFFFYFFLSMLGSAHVCNFKFNLSRTPTNSSLSTTSSNSDFPFQKGNRLVRKTDNFIDYLSFVF